MEHPITPPPELIEEWRQDTLPCYRIGGVNDIAAQAARWGADQELEACCEWVGSISGKYGPRLRIARRPKPPSLKEQALEAQQRMWDGGVTREDWELVRLALEQLDD